MTGPTSPVRSSKRSASTSRRRYSKRWSQETSGSVRHPALESQSCSTTFVVREPKAISTLRGKSSKMNGKRKALGRGLSSLIPDVPPESREGLMMVEVDRISPNRFQPRIKFKDLEGLAASIKENGVIQPIIVTEDQGGYQLVA